MKKKLFIIFTIIILITLFIVTILFVKQKQIDSKSINIKLDKNYLTSVEISDKTNFILVINKSKKISNILFLNKESTILKDRKIEGKDFDSGIKIIVQTLKEENMILSSSQKMVLINYGDSNIASKINNIFNKYFVIYGLDNKSILTNSILQEKEKELNLKMNTDNYLNIKELYNYSKKVLGEENGK